MSNIIYSDICGSLKKEQDIRSFLSGAKANHLSQKGFLTAVMSERRLVMFLDKLIDYCTVVACAVVVE